MKAPYTILVKLKGRKRALRLRHDGYLTGKRVHASIIHDLEKAERIAAEIATENADLVESARVASF